MNGSARIEKGRIYIKNPKEGGYKARIYAHPYVTIKVNDREIQDSMEVTEEDHIDIIPKEEKPSRAFKIRTDKEGFMAYGMIEYKKGWRAELKDTAGELHLRLDVEKKELFPEKYTYAELIEILEEQKIVFGILRDGVNQILEDPGNEMLIARGITPEKGTDGRIDYLFYPKEEKEDPNDINKRVDYKNVNEIPSVKKGDLLVVKTPPLYGKNGTNIYGKTIKPPNPKNPRFLPGNNVRVDEEGLKAYSLVDGKPVVRGKVLHVFSVHEVYKDVDIETGNIHFFGDVIVRGNVHEGMSIKAGHNITIHGSVSGAHIQAGGEVWIKGKAIKSTIIAGAQQTQIKKLHNYFSKLHFSILQLYKASLEVLERFKASGAKEVSVGKIIAMVLEKHFSEIMSILKELELSERSQLPSVIDDEFYGNIKYLIDRYSVYGVLSIKDLGEIKEDILLLGEMKEKLETQFQQPMNIVLDYGQNVSAKASGDILITGQGFLNSHIFSGGSVSMVKEDSHKPSVFRGGKLECEKEVRINEIGSEGGAITKIEVGRKGRILFNRMYYNTHIKIGESKKKIEENLTKGICYRNRRGDIIIHST